MGGLQRRGESRPGLCPEVALDIPWGGTAHADALKQCFRGFTQVSIPRAVPESGAR